MRIFRSWLAMCARAGRRFAWMGACDGWRAVVERAGSPFYDAARTGCATCLGDLAVAQERDPPTRERFRLLNDGEPGANATGKKPVVPVLVISGHNLSGE